MMSNRDRRILVFLVLVSVLGIVGASGARAQDEVESLLDELRGLAGSSNEDPKRLVAGEMARVEGAAGIRFRGPVEGAWITREQAVAHIEHVMEAQLPEPRLRALEAAWRGLGLLGPKDDLKAQILDLYGQQASGFYDPERRSLYLLRDMPSSLQLPVIRHELVHALQDQTWGLTRWIGDAAEDEDRSVAIQAVLEGHATEVMNRISIFGGEDLQAGDDVPSKEVAARELAEALDGLDLEGGTALGPGVGELMAELAKLTMPRDTAPALIAQLLFPYSTGASWIGSYRAAHPGDPACEALYRKPPRSTAEVIDPRRWEKQERPILAEPGAFVPGWERVLDSAVGQLLTHVLVTNQPDASAGDPEAGRWDRRDSDRNAPVGGGWRGDRVAVYRRLPGSSGKNVPDGFAVVWVSEWRDAREAQAVGEALRSRGKPATVEVRGSRVEAVCRDGGGDRKAMATALGAWR